MMIEVIQELIESGFCLALTAAVVAAPVALLALVVDLLAGGWMAARFRCWLWVVVAIRLLMPMAPGSAASLQNAWSFLDRTPTTQASAERAALETIPLEWGETWSDPTGLPELVPVRVHATPVSRIDWEMVLALSLVFGWLVGAAWVLLRAVVASFRFRRQLQALPAVDDSAIIDTVRLACGHIGVTAPVVKRVPDLPAPALFELGRPTLCLPEGENLTDSQLRMIALHEAMHIRRRDGWLAWLLAAVRAAHWFNPIAWLAVSRVASTQPTNSSQWGDDSPVEAGKPSVSIESASFDFAPFMVFSLNEDEMKSVVEWFATKPSSLSMHAPKVTLFSGQTGTIRDQSHRPFVTSVDCIRGPYGTAAQPNIVVLDEGTRIDYQPKMHDHEHLDLRCRLTLSAIDDVRTINLPGAGSRVTVQVPKVTRKVVSTSCRMKQGETLLIASLDEKTFYYAITPRWFADPVAAEE
jgi:beta-lactamase regulating signal transducer with metallopeptidase domain